MDLIFFLLMGEILIIYLLGKVRKERRIKEVREKYSSLWNNCDDRIFEEYREMYI